MSNKYKNPPVIEAVFEIRFPAELSIESQRNEYYEKIRKCFPNISIPGSDSPDPYPLKPYRFETDDKKKLIQFSINKFSFHCKKYETFQEFSLEALKYMDLFCKQYKITKLKRTGLRYINHIPVEREKGIVKLAKYLKFGYVLPNTIPNNLELFHTVILTGIDEGKLRILIASQEAMGPGRREIIVLDFDYFLEGELLVDHLKNYIQKSHLHTKKIFESLISDEYRKLIMEED